MKHAACSGFLWFFVFLTVRLAVQAAAVGEKKWEFWGQSALTSPAIYTNGVLYVAEYASELYAIDSATGLAIWTNSLSDVVAMTPVLGADGTVYAGDYAENLRAIDGVTGTNKWWFNTHLCVHSSPAIGPDGTIYIGAAQYAALDSATGEPVWEAEFGGESSPAFAANGLLYAGGAGHLLALDARTGAVRWSYLSGGAMYPVLGPDGTVYATSHRAYGELSTIALDGLTGGLKWERPISGGLIVGIDSVLYVASHGRTYALNGKDGEILWEFPADDPSVPMWTPALAADGTLYAGGDKLYALDAADGSFKWSYPAQVSTEVAIGGDGTVYFSTTDYEASEFKLLAVQGSAPLATEGWPKFRQNEFNNGRYPEPPAPLLTREPESQIVTNGATVAFHVYSPSVRPISYQWLFNNAPIPSATNEFLYLANAQLDAAGDYSVIVSNQHGQVVSAPANLAFGYAVRVRTRGIGSVTRDLPGEVFGAYSTMQLTAEGENGRAFLGWTGSFNSSKNPLTVTVLSNVQLTAQFELRVADKLWEFRPAAAFLRTPAIGADGTVYFGAGEPWFYAVDGESGDVRWKFFTGSDLEASPAISSAGIVYFGTYGRKVFALRCATGEKLWEYTSGNNVSSTPSIGVDGTVYFALGGGLHAFDGETGKIKWTFAAGGPAIIASDGTLYVGGSTKLYALDATTAEIKWSVPRGGGVFGTAALDASEAIYFGSGDRRVYAVDTVTGQPKWSVPVTFTPSVIIGGDGTVYASEYRNIYALNPDTGAVRWRFIPPEGGEAPPLLAGDGTLFVTGDRLYALDALTGTNKWDYRGYAPHSPNLHTNGLLYLPIDGKLVALYIGSGLATSAWPKFQRTADNRGRAHARPMFDVGSSKETSFGFELVLHAEPGETIEFQTSSDLRTWAPLLVLTNTQPPIQFTDTSPPPAGQRFYRARLR